ncbi:hypothetical protein ACERNI_12545 [Camelimonas sp. ID_303_24]
MTLATGGPRWRIAHGRGAATFPRHGAATRSAAFVRSLWLEAVALLAVGLQKLAFREIAAAARGATRALLTGLVCLALIVTPAAALDSQGGDPAAAVALLEVQSGEHGRLDVAHIGHDHLRYDHLRYDRAGHDRANPDITSPDLHGAHHCCHSHVAPAQSFRSMVPIAVRHLTWRVGDSDVLPPRDPAPPLRPPRA